MICPGGWLIDLRQKFTRVTVKAVGDDVELLHGQVYLASLDLAHITSVDTGGVRQLFLSEPFSLSNFHKPPAESSV